MAIVTCWIVFRAVLVESHQPKLSRVDLSIVPALKEACLPAPGSYWRPEVTLHKRQLWMQKIAFQLSVFFILHVRTPTNYWRLGILMEDTNRVEVGSAGDEVAELRRICAACENALLKLLDPEICTQTLDPRIRHHEDLSSLAISSGIGCWICAAIQDHIRHTRWHDVPLLGTCLTPMFEQVQPEGSGKRSISHVLVGLADTSKPLDFPSILLTVYFEQDERGSLETISGRRVTEMANLAMACDWIDECARLHDTCGAIHEKALPTRVIDLGPASLSKPKLIESRNRLGVYTALSHCWGDFVRRDQLTTTQNMNERLRALPFEAMAPTFKDAVIATRSLGYRYLWIDAFCIIQDDDQDWARECGLMAPVFANAAVVLAASCASGSDDGFLHARPKRMPSYSIGRSSESFSAGNIQVGPHVLGFEMRTVADSFDDPAWARIGHDALSRRAWAYQAWAYQEKALCTRILSFHHEQLVFECCYGLRYERRPGYLHEPSPSVNENALLPISKDSSSSYWRKAVRNLTSRSITYGNDVLPALVGVASRYQNLTGYTFAAGLWRETFLQDIGWITSSHGSSNAKYASTCWSPSWSWTSCPGSVEFVWNYPLRFPEPKAAAEVLDLDSHPENDLNPFGAVSTAQVTLKGFYRRAKCYWEESEVYLADADGNCDRLVATFYPDSCELKFRSLEDAAEVVILPILRQPDWGGGVDTIALMLKPLNATSYLHRRIGLIRFHHNIEEGKVDRNDWLRAAEEITIRIV